MSSHNKRGRNSRQRKTSSAKQIAESEDLLPLVLKHLPAQSLVRFRLVCKHWRTLISSAEFRLTWSSTHKDIKPTGFLLWIEIIDKALRFMHLDDKMSSRRRSPYCGFPFGKVKILHSCNGLILCRSDMQVESEYFVCNPTTKQVAKLSIPVRANYGFGLAFDPKISLHYKVLCSGVSEIYVYSSEVRAWRVVEVMMRAYGPYDNQVYYKGGMYWMHSHGGLRFDIETDQLERLRLPDDLYNWHMSVCADRLYLVGSHSRMYLYYVVYEMATDGYSWVVKYTVNFGQIAKTRLTVVPRHNSEVDVLCVLQYKNGETGMVLKVPGEIVVYCLDSMVVKKFHHFRGKPFFTAFERSETLYSV